MKAILNRLIMENKGPWKDYSFDYRKDAQTICKAVADEIIQQVTSSHPDALDLLSAEYDFENDIWVHVTFFERATHTAEQIAKAFDDIAGVAVNVKVWELCSECKCNGTE